MSRLFTWTMRRAPEILFAITIAFIVGSVIFSVISAQETFDLAKDMPLPFWVRVSWFIKCFITPLAPATLPFAGAALIWRLDRRTIASKLVEEPTA